MKVYIICEHPEGMGGSSLDPGDAILGVFFDRKRAEDFMRGMASYISSYEGQNTFYADGKTQDASGTVYFQIVEKEALV